MADVVAGSSQPALGAIRLAWWRERLVELDCTPPPAEPRLQRVSVELLPLGVSGAELAELEDCWLPLLNPLPWDGKVVAALRRRGRILFGIGGRLLAAPGDLVATAGEIWSLADAAGHCTDAESRRRLGDEATALIAGLRSAQVDRRVRPLTTLAALAAHDLGSGRGSRGWVAFRHQLRGRFPAPG